MIDPVFWNINRLFSFDKYYLSVAEIKDQPIKKNKKHIKNLSQCQETMVVQSETYWPRFIKVRKYGYSSTN